MSRSLKKDVVFLLCVCERGAIFHGRLDERRLSYRFCEKAILNDKGFGPPAEPSPYKTCIEASRMRPRPLLYCTITFDLYLLFLTFSTEMTTWHMTFPPRVSVNCRTTLILRGYRFPTMERFVLISANAFCALPHSERCKSLLFIPVKFEAGDTKIRPSNYRSQ